MSGLLTAAKDIAESVGNCLRPIHFQYLLQNLCHESRRLKYVTHLAAVKASLAGIRRTFPASAHNYTETNSYLYSLIDDRFLE